ncbi:MAG TPA: LuxR C-terminal-related transcriptional regulator [bacterium]|nr:LuxR C-terminal-related transcriptional regulator [bacterium]
MPARRPCATPCAPPCPRARSRCRRAPGSRWEPLRAKARRVAARPTLRMRSSPLSRPCALRRPNWDASPREPVSGGEPLTHGERRFTMGTPCSIPWRPSTSGWSTGLSCPRACTNGRFVHINAAAERASGKLDAELLGREITHLLPREAHENVLAQFRRAIGRGEPTDFETAFVDASGHLRGVRVQHLPLRDGDTIVGVLTLAFDVRRPPSEIGLKQDPHLTMRQRQILELIASGLSTAEVAKELTLSTETVRNHLRNASKELRAHSRVEAIATAQRLGLLAAPVLGPPLEADVHRS